MVALGAIVVTLHRAIETSVGLEEPSMKEKGSRHAQGKRLHANRHNGGVNALFLNWYVRKVGLKELWTLKWRPRFDTANAWTKVGGVKPEDWPA